MPHFFRSLVATRVAIAAGTLNGAPYILGANRELLTTNPIEWINQQVP